MSFVWTPLLDTMSKAARVAWPFIQEGVSKGLGSEAIIEAMKVADIKTFRRQDMLALIREASGAEALKSDIERWPHDVIFPINRIRESVTKIVAPFSYTLRLTIRDEAGDTTEVLRQAHSSELRAFDEVADEFMSSIEGREQYEEFNVESASVVGVQRAGDLGTI